MDQSPAPPRRLDGKFARKFDGVPAQITVRVPPDRKRKIEAAAKARGCQVSDLAREWLDPIVDALPE